MKQPCYTNHEKKFSLAHSTPFGQLLLAWLLTGLLTHLAYAVPMTTNYQGYLENTEAEPLNATVKMTFALYATAQGGTALWTETHQQIEVTDGVFSVTLGSQKPFTDDSLAGERYLGVTVGSDPEMTPRQPLTSAFFAMRAGVADSVKAAAVATEAIAEGAVTAEKIAAQTITGDKIANLSGHNVTELDDVTDAGSGKIITDVEREKLESLTPGSTASSPTFENLNVKNELKVGEHTLYLAGDAQGGQIWATGGQKRLALQTNGGKVGIGTIAPQVKLHVVEPGNVSIGVENTNFESNFSALYAKTAKNNILTAIFSEGDTAQGGIGTTSNHPFYIRTNNIQRMTFDIAGKVGIGTTVPKNKLDITGSLAIGSGYAGKATAPENGLLVEGNIGIGTTNPLEKLEVKNGSIFVNAENTGVIVDEGGKKRIGLMKYWGREAGLWRVPNQDFEIGRVDNTLQSPVNFTTDFYVAGNGNIGIGNTTPQVKLHVTGSNDVNVGVENTNINSNYAQYYAKSAKGGIATVLFSEGYSGQGGVGTNSNHPFYIRTNTIQRMTVDVVGNVGIGTKTPSCKLDVRGGEVCRNGIPIKSGFSDKRWKKDIKPLENTLEKVSKLQGVNYQWDTENYPDMGFDDKPQIGLIAQEVEQVVSEVVITNNEGYKGVEYDKLTVVLIEAIKELKAQNDALKAQNDAIKAIVCEDHPEKAICQ